MFTALGQEGHRIFPGTKGGSQNLSWYQGGGGVTESFLVQRGVTESFLVERESHNLSCFQWLEGKTKWRPMFRNRFCWGCVCVHCCTVYLLRFRTYKTIVYSEVPTEIRCIFFSLLHSILRIYIIQCVLTLSVLAYSLSLSLSLAFYCSYSCIPRSDKIIVTMEQCSCVPPQPHSYL